MCVRQSKLKFTKPNPQQISRGGTPGAPVLDPPLQLDSLIEIDAMDMYTWLQCIDIYIYTYTILHSQCSIIISMRITPSPFSQPGSD